LAILAWREWSIEHLLMPGIIEFPQVVQDALAQYGGLFANECQRRHFAEYLTGLMVAERKTVLGINREFTQTTDQSCLNRFLTDADWDAEALNQRRLEELQKDPSTRYSDQGVIPIDNTLIDRDGLLIPDAGWFWDHAEERNKIAQDYLFANYLCTSGKHYPLEFRLFREKEVCEAVNEPFRNQGGPELPEVADCRALNLEPGRWWRTRVAGVFLFLPC
jgi:DDE superfamily endonuclease